MSNLFKQYNTVEPEKNVRVIDYNSAVEQKLAELARRQNGSGAESGNEFQSLEAVSDKVEMEDPEEILAKAKSEADILLKKAKTDSDILLAGARSKSNEIFQAAREDGHKEGYDAGYQEAKEVLEQEYTQKKEELLQQGRKQREDYERELQELEPKLLDVILSVVEKVFHIQFSDKKEILLYLIGNTISEIENCKSFRIRVGTGQKEFLEERRDEILDRIGRDMSIEIISDPSLEGNQCVIETDTGIFDCSMDVQLKNLIKDLKSLSS